jgi:hypothetical protein
MSPVPQGTTGGPGLAFETWVSFLQMLLMLITRFAMASSLVRHWSLREVAT